MTIIEICLSFATFAFVMIAIFLVRVLITLQQSMGRVDKLVRKVEEKLEPGGSEAIRLIQNLNDISETVDEQLHALNPLFKSVSTLGTKFESAAKSFNMEGHHPKKEEHPTSASKEKAEILMELAAFGILLWQQINKRR